MPLQLRIPYLISPPCDHLSNRHFLQESDWLQHGQSYYFRSIYNEQARIFEPKTTLVFGSKKKNKFQFLWHARLSCAVSICNWLAVPLLLFPEALESLYSLPDPYIHFKTIQSLEIKILLSFIQDTKEYNYNEL